ncbi:MAG: GNAT family N-acetyltransferase [Pseudomonadota bacterium]
MRVDVSIVSKVPDPEAFEALLLEYYGEVQRMLLAAGGPSLDPQDMVEDSLDHLDDMLPPKGRLALAHGEDGRLLGCGALRFIEGNAAEMKRMFVRTEAQHQGLGRRLFEIRLDAAKQMGCDAVYADTAKGNRPMLTMYERFGFKYVSRYPGNANPIELEPFLVYLAYEL